MEVGGGGGCSTGQRGNGAREGQDGGQREDWIGEHGRGSGHE